MNAQLQEPAQAKKPRMTEKRLREALRDKYEEGFDEGHVVGLAEARCEYVVDLRIAALGNFAAGTIIGVVAVYPALRWCWHAARAFIIAHAH